MRVPVAWAVCSDLQPVATAKSLPLLGSVVITACMHSPSSLIPATCSTSGVSSKPLNLVRCAMVGPTGLPRGTMCTVRPLEAVVTKVVVQGDEGAVNVSGDERPGTAMLMTAPAAALITIGVLTSDDARESAQAGTN